jgi:PST family polysaccharide transporter
LLGRIDGSVARSLGAYALMAATAAIVAPLGQIVIRNHLAAGLGWVDAGLWQAMWKISETHLLLLTSTLSVYFLPRFSEIRTGLELRREVRHGYAFVLPVAVASSGLLYWLREPLIRALLSHEFLPLVDVLGWQLVGDVLKIGSWLMAFTMVSHARTQAFIVTEVLFTTLFVVATMELSSVWGLRGAAFAYAMTYALYWTAMVWVFERLVHSLSRARPAAA